MSFEESTQIKPASPLEAGAPASRRESNHSFDQSKHIGPVVAHDLNNILTIVQGYADRLLLRHATNPALMPDLKLISEAAKRAATVIRNARPPSANESFRQNSSPPPAVG
jgi:light-regulated signal transduction histidine kinase (bacteriophytochrome)